MKKKKKPIKSLLSIALCLIVVFIIVKYTVGLVDRAIRCSLYAKDLELNYRFNWFLETCHVNLGEDTWIRVDGHRLVDPAGLYRSFLPCNFGKQDDSFLEKK